MKHLFPLKALVVIAIALASCSTEEIKLEQCQAHDEASETSAKEEPHRYGGWYCPDNFGFVPVDVSHLDQVPAVSHRLPTQEELKDHKSLINVDTLQYPGARALDMDLPRLASIYSKRKDMSQLVVVIQAIVVQEDTVVGYRFVDGGNGSAWIQDVEFLSENEVESMGAQPYFYSKSIVKANPKKIWNAMTETAYFNELGLKFEQDKFFSSEWNPEAEAHLNMNTAGERAVGYVGMVYGNYYLQIDYERNGVHYSEKVLLSENQEDNTTEVFFANGPYPSDYEEQKINWERLIEELIGVSEGS